MTRDAVHAEAAPPAAGPYSHAVHADGFVFLSGQASFDPDTGEVVEGGIKAQTRQVFANLAAVLAAADADFDDVVKVNVYLTDLADFPVVNDIYAEHFSAPPPARTTVGVAGLPLGAAVEIEMVARLSRTVERR